MDLVNPDIAAYADAHTTQPTETLVDIAAVTQAETPAPQMMSGTPEARLLQAFLVAGDARRVLEIGTFTGFGALAMAARLPADGRVTTIEFNEETAAMARRHIDASPHGEKVELIVGDAME